jgi:hypothetical protein
MRKFATGALIRNPENKKLLPLFESFTWRRTIIPVG